MASVQDTNHYTDNEVSSDTLTSAENLTIPHRVDKVIEKTGTRQGDGEESNSTKRSKWLRQNINWP